MRHILSIEIPDEMYEPLVQTAQKTGRTAEELATQWLLLAIHNTMTDPIEKFIGVFPTNIANWADEHDTFLGLGQQLTEEKPDGEENTHA